MSDDPLSTTVACTAMVQVMADEAPELVNRILSQVHRDNMMADASTFEDVFGGLIEAIPDTEEIEDLFSGSEL